MVQAIFIDTLQNIRDATPTSCYRLFHLFLNACQHRNIAAEVVEMMASLVYKQGSQGSRQFHEYGPHMRELKVDC